MPSGPWACVAAVACAERREAMVGCRSSGRAPGVATAAAADQEPVFAGSVTAALTYPAVMWAPRSVVATVVVSLLFAGVLSGCTSTPTPTPTSSVSPTSASATSSPPPATEGLRGYGVSSLDCPTKAPTSRQDRPLQPITGEVQEYVICPYVWGTRQPHAHVLTPGSSAFDIFDRALRRPDEPPSNGPCPAIAMAPRVILVQTTDGDWDVHIPTDDCGFYQAGVRNVLAQVDRER